MSALGATLVVYSVVEANDLLTKAAVSATITVSEAAGGTISCSPTVDGEIVLNDP